MKNYYKPEVSFIELRVEERFAGSTECNVTGSCFLGNPLGDSEFGCNDAWDPITKTNTAIADQAI